MSKTGYVEIYNQLLFGNALTLQFSSKQEAQSLRAALHTLHSRSQSQFNNLGLELVQGRITFVCIDHTNNKYKIQIVLGETKKPRKSFQILSSEPVSSEV